MLWKGSPANISKSDHRCFNVVDQRWNNVDSTSNFPRCAACTTLKQRQNNVTQSQNNVGTTLLQPSVDVS